MSRKNDVLVPLLVLLVHSAAKWLHACSLLVILAPGPLTLALGCGAVVARLSRIAAKFVLVAPKADEHAQTFGGRRCRRNSDIRRLVGIGVAS
jgi:hypothetical protein